MDVIIVYPCLWGSKNCQPSSYFFKLKGTCILATANLLKTLQSNIEYITKDCNHVNKALLQY